MRAALWIALFLFFSTPAGAAGFDEQYDVRRGHYDTDGLLDLYVSSARGPVPIAVDDLSIVIPPAVASFVLRNEGNGSFTLVTSLTSAQRTSMRAWPQAAVDLSWRDVDVNGSDDLTIENLGAVVAGAFDQIVFAPRTRGKPPIQVTAKNAKFQSYHKDLIRWMLDRDYFTNVPLKLVSAQPATPIWFGFVADPQAYSSIFAMIAECKSRFPTRSCGYTSIDPTPNSADAEDCTRPVLLRDHNMQPLGVDPDHDVCQYSAHVYVYIPSSVTLVADTSIYDTDAKETAQIIDKLRDNCPTVPLLDPEEAHRVEVILGRVYGQNIFVDQGRGPVNANNSVPHPPVPGDGAFNPTDPTFHHYDVKTRICALGSLGCDQSHLRDLLRYFSFPSYELKPVKTKVDGVEEVLVRISLTGTEPDDYTIWGGYVTQHFIDSGFWQGAIQNITRPTHIVYPGTITRTIMQNGSSLHVFTHGIGLNRLFCTVFNQHQDLPVQMIFGFSNDVFGAAAFRALDKQMTLQFQSNPVGLPSGSSGGSQKPQASVTQPMMGGINSAI